MNQILSEVSESEEVNGMKTEKYSSEMNKERLLRLLSEILSKRNPGLSLTVKEKE